MSNLRLNVHSMIRQYPLAVLSLLVVGLNGCNWVEVASRSNTGEQGNSTSAEATISADGRYVAFRSVASNLVEGVTDNQSHIFVRDMLTGSTSHVSVDNGGNVGNHSSFNPAISGDGRYVAFESFASNLVAGDTNNQYDVFVHDTLNDTTTRVSVDNAGNQAVGNDSISPSLSADGRYVVFQSMASNLVAGDTMEGNDIFIRDTLNGTTTLISVNSAGTQGNNVSGNSSISADGRYVAFFSTANNLVVGDTNGTDDIFLRDTLNGTTTRVSVDSAGTQGNGSGDNSYPAISVSADGRYVAFVSPASNLVAGDTNGVEDVFVRDTLTGTTARVSVDSAGNEGEYDSDYPSVSADGRYVSFVSYSGNFVAGDTNGAIDVFVRDTLNSTTRRVSVDSGGAEGIGDSKIASLSADGRYVVFETNATNLVPNDTNGFFRDIVVRALPEVIVTSMIPNSLTIGATTAVTINGANFLAGAVPFVGSAQVSNSVVVNENTITANVTVPAGSAVGAQDVSVAIPGTGPGPSTGVLGNCAACVTFSLPSGC